MSHRARRALFVVTILTGSFLLFLMQPMIARMALPRLGGAPAVWNSAMMVYQALLLGGYAYAHALGRLAPRGQAAVHLAVLAVAALWLPIGLAAWTPPAEAAPELWAPWLLLGSIGPLFLAVSAQAPLMQRWFAAAGAGHDPYPLYAASNLGSFAGLIAYPLLAEPLLGLSAQSGAWSIGYGLLLLLVIGCAAGLPAGRGARAAAAETPRPGAAVMARWVALAAVPSGLMLSTTAHLTTDVVAVPLIWVIPLGLYLLSFTVAFSARGSLAETIGTWFPVVMLVAGGFAFMSAPNSPWASALLGLSLLFTVAVTLHHALYRARPDPSHLTAFYLATAVGGVAGGLFCAILAPLLFDWVYEHPLLILAAAVLAPQAPLLPRLGRLWHDRDRARGLALAIGAATLAASLAGAGLALGKAPLALSIAATVLIGLGAVVAIGERWLFAWCLGCLMLLLGGWNMLFVSLTTDGRTRSYFGLYTIADRADGARDLIHGTTLHGTQWRGRGRERWPTTYYVPRSGVGRAMRAAPALFGEDARIGVVGLGTGTLACYARPGQRWRFYEIDRTVAAFARDPAWFSFLDRCLARTDIAMGDARLTLAAAPAAAHDLLAVDAFSSDAVPMHLLTREAFAVYARALAPGGLLMLHVSNRYIDLEPVLAAEARAGGWHMLALDYTPDKAEAARGASASSWVAASRDPETIDALMRDEQADPAAWRAVRGRRGFAGWSDDRGSILPLLKFGE